MRSIQIKPDGHRAVQVCGQSDTLRVFHDGTYVGVLKRMDRVGDNCWEFDDVLLGAWCWQATWEEVENFLARRSGARNDLLEALGYLFRRIGQHRARATTPRANRACDIAEHKVWLAALAVLGYPGCRDPEMTTVRPVKL